MEDDKFFGNPPTGRVTLKDVAARAGVTVSTASKVINETRAGTRVSEATRLRIKQTAAEMNYHPSAVGRALVRRRTDTIGLILPPQQQTTSLRHPYFSVLLEAALDAAGARGLDTMVFTGKTWTEPTQGIDRLLDGRCDGHLLFYQPDDSPLLPALIKAQIPLVLAYRNDDVTVAQIVVDNVLGMRQMTEYLVSLGHRRIAFVGDMPEIAFVQGRLQGYREALRAHALPEDPTLIHLGYGVWNPDRILELIQALMARGPSERPTAFCNTNDEVAAFTVAALTRMGWRVPEEVSVTGFNDDNSAERCQPPLTTMRHPYQECMAKALDLLQAQVEGRGGWNERVVFQAERVVRGSTGRCLPAVNRG